MKTSPSPSKPTVKCLVWDLDNTLWDGVLLAGDAVSPRPEAVAVLKALDERGILHSIASKNDPDAAMQTLHALGLDEYFLYPQIGWGAKSEAVKAIARQLNIGLDAIAFVDDQPFEREEVRFSLPDVRCFDPADLPILPTLPDFTPSLVTDDARHRREMYRSEQQRQAAEARFDGPAEAFLASLDMRLTLFPAGPDDLARAEELTLRTNQLNATGYTYSLAQLDHFRRSDCHLLLMARLEDRFGGYGNIGLALVEQTPNVWLLKLLLMSCRVMRRGIGAAMLAHLIQQASAQGVRLQAEFIPNGRNRMMEVTYRFAGFREIARRGKRILLEHDLSTVPEFPPYLRVEVLP